jgi:hypothetical protein
MKWGIKQEETDDQEENDGVTQENRERPSAKHCEALAYVEGHGEQLNDGE